MKKHICVLICYLNYEHIIKCYKSLQTEFTDFFIVENKSVNSDKIHKFFMKEKPLGYIQFQENISNNAMKIFLEDFKYLLKDYEYITRSDCDLYIEDSISTFNEIFKNLQFENVIMSSVDLSLLNLPRNIKGSDKWIPNPKKITKDYIEGNTGGHLMTVKNNDLNLFYATKCKDTLIYKEVCKRNKKWVKTLINKAYHLTWDLYYDGSDYLKFKRQQGNKLWNHTRISKYIKYI